MNLPLEQLTAPGFLLPASLTALLIMIGYALYLYLRLDSDPHSVISRSKAYFQSVQITSFVLLGSLPGLLLGSADQDPIGWLAPPLTVLGLTLVLLGVVTYLLQRTRTFESTLLEDEARLQELKSHVEDYKFDRGTYQEERDVLTPVQTRHWITSGTLIILTFTAATALGIGTKQFLENTTTIVNKPHPAYAEAEATNPYAVSFQNHLSELYNQLGEEMKHLQSSPNPRGDLTSTYELYLERNDTGSLPMKRNLSDSPYAPILEEARIYRTTNRAQKSFGQDPSARQLIDQIRGLTTYGYYATRLEADVRIKTVGHALAKLHLLERLYPHRDDVAFYKGMLFYMAGNADAALKPLQYIDPPAVKEWRNAFVGRLKYHIDKIKGESDFTRLMRAEAYRLEGYQQEAINRYISLNEDHDNDILYLRHAINDLANLDTQKVNAHRTTQQFIQHSLDLPYRVFYPDQSPGENGSLLSSMFEGSRNQDSMARVNTQYDSLVQLRNRAVENGAHAKRHYLNLSLDYFRTGLYERFNFTSNTLGSRSYTNRYLKTLTQYFPEDPMVRYMKLHNQGERGSFHTVSDTLVTLYQESGLPTPYRQEILSLLHDDRAEDIVGNEIDDRYEHWIRYRTIANAASNQSWFDVRDKYLEKMLVYNPYLPFAYKRLSTPGDMGPFKRGREVMPNSWWLHYEHNEWYYETAFSYLDDKIDSGLPFYEKEFEKYPESNNYTGWLIDIHRARGHYDEAIEYGQQAVGDTVGGVGEANTLASVGWIQLFYKENPEKALTTFRRIIDVYNRGSIEGYARTLEALGRIEKARRWFRKTNERYGHYNNGALMVAFYLRQGEREKAIEFIKKQDWSGDSVRDFTKQLFTMYWDSQYPTGVLLLYEHALTDEEEWGRYDYANIACAHLLKDQPRKAADVIKRAWDRDIQSPFLNYFYYAAQVKLGQSEKGLEVMKQSEGSWYHMYIRKIFRQDISLSVAKKEFINSDDRGSYLSTLYGLYGYKYMAEGSPEKARAAWNVAAKSIRYKKWYLSILSIHEAEQRTIY